MKNNSFVKDLQHVINLHSRENDSDTPDFILAGLVEDLLHTFAKAQRARDKWYGFTPWSKISGVSGGFGEVPVVCTKEECRNQEDLAEEIARLCREGIGTSGILSGERKFLESVEAQAIKNHRVTKKQESAVRNVYDRILDRQNGDDWRDYPPINYDEE